MLSTKIIIAIAIIIASLGVGIIITSISKDQQEISDSMDKTRFIDDLSLPPPSPLKATTGISVKSIDEASKLANYKVPYPQYLPEGYSIQYIKVIKDDKIAEVGIYAWDKEITDNTTDRGFFYEKNGMIIYITNNTSNTVTVLDELISFYSAYKAHKLTIDGYQCVAYDSQIVEDVIGRKVPLLAELNCLKDKLLIQIRAYLPESELIKVAESML